MKTLSRRLPVLLVAVAAAVVALAPAPQPVRAHSVDELPNIAPLPARDVRIGPADDRSGLALRFSSWMANTGDYHFDVAGIPNASLPLTAAAAQCTDWASSRVCASRQAIGTFEYHAAHGHWHFQDFARYELRSTGGSLVAVSDKVSFCMMDSAPVRNERPLDAAITYPLYLACDVGTQGISAGWADIYGYDLPGQQLELAGVPDGTYDLVIVADPSELILETDDSDNTSVRRVVISGGGTAVTVVG